MRRDRRKHRTLTYDVPWSELSDQQRRTLAKLADRGPTDTSSAESENTVQGKAAGSLVRMGYAQHVPKDDADNYGGLYRVALTAAGARMARDNQHQWGW